VQNSTVRGVLALNVSHNFVNKLHLGRK